jgi:hypothetical protein
MEPDIEEKELGELEILNIHFKNGKNLIAGMVFADEHTLILSHPIELKKRVSFSKTGAFEVITTSPFLLMTDSTTCTIPTSEVFCKNWLHENLIDMYKKLVSKYYMDISNIIENVPSPNDTPTGTIH